MLLGQIDELLMVDVSCSDNVHVFSVVHSLMEVHDHFARYLVDVVDFSQNRQAHHVALVHVEVDLLHQGFEVVVVGCLQFLPNGALFSFHVNFEILAVEKHVSKDIYCQFYVVSEDQHMV